MTWRRRLAKKFKAVIEEMGYAAAMMLVDLMRGDVLESNRHKIPTQLVIRDSCRAIGTRNQGSRSSAGREKGAINVRVR